MFLRVAVFKCYKRGTVRWCGIGCARQGVRDTKCEIYTLEVFMSSRFYSNNENRSFNASLIDG